MQCPKCGNENPDNVWICSSCRRVLRNNVSIASKTSRLAVLSLVLGIFSLLLSVLTGIPAIVIGIISIVRIARSGGMLRGKRIAMAGILTSVLLMGILPYMWTLDAPPIPDDYTVADLRSAPADCAESFELLKLLTNEKYDTPGAPAIGLTKEDLDMSAEIREVIEGADEVAISEILSAYARDIERAWKNMKDARQVVTGLNSFAEIADLTDLNADGTIMRVQNLIELARFYQVYGHLKIQQGGAQAFAADLIELDSVYRKLTVNVRWIVPKFACFISMMENIVTANAIVNNVGTPASTIEEIAVHFTHPTAEQLSLRNCVLSQYLAVKDSISHGAGWPADKRIPVLKPNSTLRYYRNDCDRWLNAQGDSRVDTSRKLSVWPSCFPFDELDSVPGQPSPSLIYRLYNPLGSIVVRMRGDPRGTTHNEGTYLSVKADLLLIVLDKRLGRQVSLKARAYSDEYMVDVEGKRILSPGPDGEVGTKDDVWLAINPEFLGW